MAGGGLKEVLKKPGAAGASKHNFSVNSAEMHGTWEEPNWQTRAQMERLAYIKILET
jgi:hypothetical protein